MTLREAVRILKNGGVVAYPTETFYGLGAIPTNKKALESVFSIKGRDRQKPIMLIISSRKEVSRWARDGGEVAKKLMRGFWPGPLTLVMRARKSVPWLLTGGTGTIGLRLSSDPIARRLARSVGGALTATSANRAGHPPPHSWQDVVSSMGRKVDGVIPYPRRSKSKGSTILDISSKGFKVIREGEIPRKKIEDFIKEDAS